MFSNALKNLAVELNVCMMTSTQVNASADETKSIRGEGSLAGGRATINKADNGAVIARPSKEELKILQPLSDRLGVPNLVTDIFKVRSGEWTQVRIWSIMNLGTMRRKDLFITDANLEPIDSFFDYNQNYRVRNWDNSYHSEILNYMKELNN